MTPKSVTPEKKKSRSSRRAVQQGKENQVTKPRCNDFIGIKKKRCLSRYKAFGCFVALSKYILR